MTDDAIQTYNKVTETSERVGLAVNEYRKLHPEVTFEAAEVEEIAKGVQLSERAKGGKLTQKQLTDIAIPAFVSHRSEMGALTTAIAGGAVALDGGLTATGMRAATATGRYLGPAIGGAIVLGEAGYTAYNGNYQDAAINATSGTASILAAAGTGAILCTGPAPVVGTAACAVAGAVVGTVMLYGSKWGLNQIFNSSAEQTESAPAPVVRIAPLVKQNNVARLGA